MTAEIKKFNHAFALAFDMQSMNDADSTKGSELRAALLLRISNLSDAELVVACGEPFDTVINDDWVEPSPEMLVI